MCQLWGELGDFSRTQCVLFFVSFLFFKIVKIDSTDTIQPYDRCDRNRSTLQKHDIRKQPNRTHNIQYPPLPPLPVSFLSSSQRTMTLKPVWK